MASTAVDARVDAAPPSGPAPDGGAPRQQHGPRRWWALAVIGLAQLMVVLDATIVNIALPSAQKDLAFGNDSRQWIVTAYSLAFGSLLLLGGRLADLFGRRTTFLIGLVGFAAASALGGAANGFTMLVVARALQGVFGAVLAPSALSLLTTTFTDVKERSKAFGIFGAIAGSGGAIGLLLGGVLTEHLNWRWTLYVNDVIAVFAVIGALVFLRRQAPAERPRLDLLGTVLVACGLFGVVYGFSNAETHDWDNWMCWAFLAAGGVLLVLFVLWEMVARHPLLPLRVLGDRNRAASYLSVFISGAGMFGVFLFLTYYLQGTLGYSPVKTGLAFLPMVGSLMVMAQVSTNLLVPRIGPKPVAPVGMALAAGGLVVMRQLDLHSGYAHDVLPSLLLMGVGLGLVMPTAMSLATFGVAPHDQGVASATVNTMQQVGGSIATALFNTLAATAATNWAKDHALEYRRTPHLLEAKAQLHSYSTAYGMAAVFFVVGLVVALLLYRKGRPMARAATVRDETGETAVAAPEQGAGAGQDVFADFEKVVAGPSARPGELAGAAGGPAGPVVRGRVLAAGHTPVPEAAVTLIDPAGRQLGRTIADLSGHYSLRVPERGTYLLVGSSAGQQPKVASLTVGDSPVELDLLLAGTGGLYGTVRAAGEPVPGALVVAMDAHGEIAARTTSGEDGDYELPGLVAGGYTLAVSASGHQPNARPATVDGSSPTRQDAELRAAVMVRGTVRDRFGAPLEDARVTLLDPAGNVIGKHTTGPDGVYVFTDLANGEYTLVATGYPPAPTSVSVSGTGRGDLDITLGHEDD